MSDSSRKSEELPRKPFALLYYLACVFAKFFFSSRFGLKIDNSALKGLRGPLLVIGNHCSNYDFFITACALLPHRVNFMVSTYFLNHSALRALLKLMGCYPKRQFVPDTASVKTTMRLIRAGRCVAIYPEGQVCYSGMNNTVDESIGKLARRLGATVVLVKSFGAYLTVPKWSGGKKCRGTIDCVASVLASAGELSEMTDSQAGELIRSALELDEFAEQKKRLVEFVPIRDAQGAQLIAYRCPSCETDFSMKPDGHALVCERCGYAAEFDKYELFVQHGDKPLIYDSLSEWFRYEREVCERTAQDGSFSFSSACRLYRTVRGKFGYFPCGEGTMTADEHGLHFTGERDGKPFSLHALVEHQTNVTHNIGHMLIDVPGEDTNYGLAPDDPRKMMKFIQFYLIAHEAFERSEKSNTAQRA